MWPLNSAEMSSFTWLAGARPRPPLTLFPRPESRIASGPPALPRMLMAALAIAATVTLAATARAAETIPFFAGKTVRILVGFSAGGGYDLYARELGRYLGRHIPGNPSIVVQNMVGAGSLKAVNFLYNAAPRDGTVLATFARGIVVEPLIGHLDGAQFDAPKFNC